MKTQPYTRTLNGCIKADVLGHQKFIYRPQNRTMIGAGTMPSLKRAQQNEGTSTTSRIAVMSSMQSEILLLHPAEVWDHTLQAAGSP
jgi:hypothetical protein